MKSEPGCKIVDAVFIRQGSVIIAESNSVAVVLLSHSVSLLAPEKGGWGKCQKSSPIHPAGLG
ncbi:hypothetical protein AO726_03265 [Pseudomonas sp. TTU2014-080ASC]|nr:hypothetical protein AO726_03265 [Pseudomonas sp. TTU2014-080ASC]